MAPHSSIFRELLETQPEWLGQIRRGVEKEGLRVTASDATLAQTAHPIGLGSALTHPAITTDYSEALLELITPAYQSIEQTEQALANLHRFTARHLNKEIVWNASMPCIVHGDAGIPIAQFGNSNVGQMKRIYRNGLSVRYGRKMQAIAGIHYNFSLPDTFWQAANRVGNTGLSPQAFQTEGYLALIRNFFSRVWFLMYLLGASPAVCASFIQGNKDHPLQPMGNDQHSFFLPHATTLRMGDLGYTSNAQADMDVCYNDLQQYISTLRHAILTPHPPYTQFDKMGNGEQAQLNTSLLQIENEYYSPIRPKRVARSGEAPVVALARQGIEYVEVRCVDINPFTPLGIDADTMRTIDLFLLTCLLDESPLCDAIGQRQNKINLKRMVNRGREPGLTLLSRDGTETPMTELAEPILERMEEIAGWCDTHNAGDEYGRIVSHARKQFADPNLTLSARVLSEIETSQQSFWQLALRYSRQWHEQHLAEPISDATWAAMSHDAATSLQRQEELEAQQKQPFDVYLKQFYRQYENVK